MTDEATTLVRLGDTDLTLASEADDVRGRKVVDSRGEEIGHVDALIIDRGERRVRFLEVAAGGFLGIGKRMFLVPVDAVTAVDEDTVHISRDRDHITGGPGYDPELTPAPERGQAEEVYGHWGYLPYWGPDYRYPPFPYR
jgi:sporulation protein YlmC with PRC-barrel domain